MKIKEKIKELIDKNKKIMPLILVLFFGGLFVLYNNIDWSGKPTESLKTTLDGLPEDKKTDYGELEKIIDDYKQKSFDPSWLSTTVTQINTNFSEFADVEQNLTQKAVAVSEQKVFQQCENYLLHNIGSSAVLNKNLSQLKIYGATNPNISFYKNQIQAMDYYTKSLVSAINTFTRDPYGFTIYKKNSLVGKVNQMGGLHAKYTTNSIKRLRKDMLFVLDEIHTQSAQPEPQPVKKISYSKN